MNAIFIGYIFCILLIPIPGKCQMVFNQLYYLGSYHNFHQTLDIPNMILLNYHPETTVTLGGAHQCQIDKQSAVDTTVTCRPDLFSTTFDDPIVILKIYAFAQTKDNETIQTYADVVLNIIPEPILDPTWIKFHKTNYIAHLKNGVTLDLTHEDIFLVPSFNNGEPITLHIKNRNLEISKWVQPQLENNNVTLEIVNSGPIDTSINGLVFDLIAQWGNKMAVASVVLEIDQGNLAPDPFVITFDKYSIQRKYLDELPCSLDQLVAHYEGNPNETFHYYQNDWNPVVPHVIINGKSGELYLETGLSPNVYTLDIRAFSWSNNAIGIIFIYIVLDDRPELMDMVIESVPYSQLLVHVLEDQKDEIMIIPQPKFPDSDENKEKYTYCIETVYPDIADSFLIKNGAVYSKTILRETEYFRDFVVPQFTLTLKLVKLTEQTGCVTKNPIQDQYQNETLINQVNSRYTTIITVIVDDANNHAPHYKENVRPVGYPSKDIVDYIRPPFLTQVKATDADSVETGFGNITYSIVTGDEYYIRVHPTNGEVYPTTNIYNGNAVHVVRAFDSEFRYDDLYLYINILPKEYIGVMVVEKSVDQVVSHLEEISRNGVTLKLMKMGSFFISNWPLETRSVEVLIYAFNEYDEPMSVENMIRYFKEENLVVNFTGYQIPVTDSDSSDSCGLHHFPWIVILSYWMLFLAKSP